MRNIAVFCGSSIGKGAIYREEAKRLGSIMTSRNIGLVYGGAKIGIMGTVANEVLQCNGTAIGVIPTFLTKKEVVHESLSELIVVDTMHERKSKMFELSDAFIALPGGFGTLEELFEILTWAQLNLHQKPIGILNTNGYYDSLIDLMDNMVANGFLRISNRDLVIVSESVEELLREVENYKPIFEEKWIKNKM